MRRPNIAITAGDPAGVGPEVVLRALSNQSLVADARLIVFGDADVLRACSALTHAPWPSVEVVTPETFFSRQFNDFDSDRIDGPHLIVDFQAINLFTMKTGSVSAQCGEAAFVYIQRAIDAALAGRVDAVTTAPINKEALHAAGHNYPGHTEMFAERADSRRWCMMQYSDIITCTFVTVHCGYAEVPALLTKDRIVEVIELTDEALRKIRGKAPHITVCGLNPHAGENGLFGNNEERDIIVPAIAYAKQNGIDVEGPLPPDTAFTQDRLSRTDAVVCMYHDQGHIPVKCLAFDRAVNTTLGLKVIRTSVDHGTAFDIAWQGKVNPGSMFAAIRLAAKLSTRSLS